MAIEVQYSEKIDMWPASNWCNGRFYNRGRWYKFESKIFENPSHFGINGGRISLLWVKCENTGKVTFDYYRDGNRAFQVGNIEMTKKGYIAELIDHLECRAREFSH